MYTERGQKSKYQTTLAFVVLLKEIYNLSKKLVPNFSKLTSGLGGLGQLSSVGREQHSSCYK